MSKTSKSFDEVEKNRARSELKRIVKPKTVIYTVLRHVSASGMQRRISSFIIAKDTHTKKPTLRCIDWYVQRLTSYQPKAYNLEGLVVNGCGMDAGYEIVHALGDALWPKGTPKPHGTRNGVPDSAGAYALKHQWV